MLEGSWETFVLVGLIVGLGQFVYAALGFGAALISISLLSLLFGDVSFFVPFFLFLCLPVEVFISFKDRKKITFSHIGPIVLISSPFIFFGGLFLRKASDTRLLFMMGFVVLLTAWYTWVNPQFKFKKEYRGIASWFVGAFSGFLGGLFGMSGPPLVLYFKSIGLPKQDFRVALISIFLALGIVRSGVYAFLGLYNTSTLHLAMFSLPFVLIGLFLGNAVHYKVSEGLFKKATSALLLVSGILLMLKNWPF